MKYLDNLIAWGDHLFRQDTIETLNEATQLYVLAANLLGPEAAARPARCTSRSSKTYAQLKAAGIDKFGNALVELENQFPFNSSAIGERRRERERGRRRGVRHRPDAVLLHPAERQAARLLGHRRGPAVQDPALHEHRGRRPAARAVRSADRSRRARSRRWPPASTSRASSTTSTSRCRRSAGRCCCRRRRSCAPRSKALGGALLRRSRRATPSTRACCGSSTSSTSRPLTRDVRFLQWKEAEEATDGAAQEPRDGVGEVPALQEDPRRVGRDHRRVEVGRPHPRRPRRRKPSTPRTPRW